MATTKAPRPLALGYIRNNRRPPGTGTASHSRRNKHHVTTGQGGSYFILVFFNGPVSHGGICSRTKAMSEVLANLDLVLSGRTIESLHVGIDHAELDILNAACNHVVHGIPATATYTDDFDPRSVIMRIIKFDGHCTLLG